MRATLLVLILHAPLFGMVITGVPQINLRYDDPHSTSVRPTHILRELGDIVDVRLLHDNGSRRTYRINLSQALQYRACLHGRILQERGMLLDPASLQADALFSYLRERIEQEDDMAVRHLVPRAYRTNAELLKELLNTYGQKGHAICALEYARIRLRDLRPLIAQIPTITRDKVAQFRTFCEQCDVENVTAATYDSYYDLLRSFKLENLWMKAICEVMQEGFFVEVLCIIDLIRCTRPASLAKIEDLMARQQLSAQLPCHDLQQDTQAYFRTMPRPKTHRDQELVILLDSLAAGIKKALPLVDTRKSSCSWVSHMLPPEDALPAPTLTDAHKRAIRSVLKAIIVDVQDKVDRLGSVMPLSAHEGDNCICDGNGNETGRTRPTLYEVERELDRLSLEVLPAARTKID